MSLLLLFLLLLLLSMLETFCRQPPAVASANTNADGFLHNSLAKRFSLVLFCEFSACFTSVLLMLGSREDLLYLYSACNISEFVCCEIKICNK